MHHAVRDEAVANATKRMAAKFLTFNHEGTQKAREVADSMLIALAELNKSQQQALDEIERGLPAPAGFVFLDKKDRINETIKSQGAMFGSNYRYSSPVVMYGAAMFRSELGFLAAESKKRKAEALKHEEERRKLAAVSKKNQMTLSFA